MGCSFCNVLSSVSLLAGRGLTTVTHPVTLPTLAGKQLVQTCSNMPSNRPITNLSQCGNITPPPGAVSLSHALCTQSKSYPSHRESLRFGEATAFHSPIALQEVTAGISASQRVLPLLLEKP